MLDEKEQSTYAAGAAAALRVMGSTPRDDVLRMLRRLDLTEIDAAGVIAYGIAQGMLAEDAGRCVTATGPKR